MKARLAGALASARERIGAPVELALILGSGLGDLADAVENPRVLPYAGIPGFPVSTAPGHAGELVAGTLFGRRVAVMRGRLHLYEGWTAQEVALGVRLLAGLGATRLVVTNAAGALNPDFAPGDAMLIEDHLNFTGQNPLIGPNEPDPRPALPGHVARLRPRAPAPRARRRGSGRRDAAPRRLRRRRRPVARDLGRAAVPARRRRRRGRNVDRGRGDRRGPCGMRVLGLSAITNSATGGPEQAPDTIEAVMAVAAEAGRRIEAAAGAAAPGDLGPL